MGGIWEAVWLFVHLVPYSHEIYRAGVSTCIKSTVNDFPGCLDLVKLWLWKSLVFLCMLSDHRAHALASWLLMRNCIRVFHSHISSSDQVIWIPGFHPGGRGLIPDIGKGCAMTYRGRSNSVPRVFASLLCPPLRQPHGISSVKISGFSPQIILLWEKMVLHSWMRFTWSMP